MSISSVEIPLRLEGDNWDHIVGRVDLGVDIILTHQVNSLVALNVRWKTSS